MKLKSFVLILLLLTRERWQHKNRVPLQHFLGKAKFPLFCLGLPTGRRHEKNTTCIGRQSLKGDAFNFIDKNLTNSCRKWAIHHGLSCISHWEKINRRRRLAWKMILFGHFSRRVRKRMCVANSMRCFDAISCLRCVGCKAYPGIPFVRNLFLSLPMEVIHVCYQRRLTLALYENVSFLWLKPFEPRRN